MKKAIRHSVLATLTCVTLSGCVIHVGGEHDIEWGLGDGVSSILGDVSISAHKSVGNISSVNGNIDIEEYVSAESVDSVNGDINIDRNVEVSDINVVNGNINADKELTVRNHVESINGDITLGQGSQIDGNVDSVNGDISLAGTKIGNDLITKNGDISLTQASIVSGSLVYEKARNNNRHIPTLYIENGSTVLGEIVLYRDVELQIDDISLRNKVRYAYQQ